VNKTASSRLPLSTPRLVTLAVALLLLALFVAENFEVVEVRLLVTERRTRLAWALLIAAALGFVCGMTTEKLRRRHPPAPPGTLKAPTSEAGKPRARRF